MNFAETSFKTETLGADYTAPPPSPPQIVTYFVTTLAAGALALTTSYTSETIANPLNPAISQSIAEVTVPRALPVSMHEAFLEMLSFAELKEGWDGPGSKPLSEASLIDALTFLKLLPAEVAAPEALAFADGTAGWNWQTSDKYITVHLPGDGRLVYYGECDCMESPVKGVALFDGQSLPADLLTTIEA
ncbi:hypothetical protein [Taklimakanibacter lacteus]|uniref:hypothetical protein n=1 Tax=Taklimakanibacter lacteus TaxID=2268456 RepID=UPI000E66BF48